MNIVMSASISSFTNKMDAELFLLYIRNNSWFNWTKRKRQVAAGACYMAILKGFESTGSTASERDNSSDEEGQIHNDFNHAPDSALLNSLTRQFHDIYNRFPDHPKYDLW